MKHFIAFAIALMAAPAFAQKTPVGVTYDANILRASDGDTVVVEALWVPAPIKKEVAVRIFGVDTPEKSFRAKCPAEDAKGQAASAFTKDLIAKSTKKQYVLYDWDKFGGRVLGDIILDGKSLREQLINNGFARPYFGDAKQSWCN
ncbi:thermonuclease family protein [bacterium]|nr:thermonuclease family protein [bacterium]